MSTNSIVLQTESLCDLQDIKEAKSYIRSYIRHTPLIQSMFLSNNITGGNVFLKLENMQFTGSFKFRGALNKILHLSDEQKEKGIITASAGNHAQGLALTGKLLDIKTTVIMPNEAPIAKQEQLKQRRIERAQKTKQANRKLFGRDSSRTTTRDSSSSRRKQRNVT